MSDVAQPVWRMAKSTLTVFGAGLIGGSLAKAARKRGVFEEIWAVDRLPPKTDDHPFDGWILAENDEAVRAIYARSSLIVLATPVAAIVSELGRALDGHAIVTDCGSTKAAIAAAGFAHKNASRFVPGHPMAGLPEGGLENACADLFEGRRWLLCPTESSDVARSIVVSLVENLGGIPIVVDPVAHDRLVAITSHVPQVLASALVVLAEREGALDAAGPGFASATRVAGGAESMWGDIFETNGPAIGKVLGELGRKLEELGKSLEQGAPESALEVLREARRARHKTPG